MSFVFTRKTLIQRMRKSDSKSFCKE